MADSRRKATNDRSFTRGSHPNESHEPRNQNSSANDGQSQGVVPSGSYRLPIRSRNNPIHSDNSAIGGESGQTRTIGRTEIENPQSSNLEGNKRAASVQLPLSAHDIKLAEARVQLSPIDYSDRLTTLGLMALADAAFVWMKEVHHPFAKDPELSDCSNWRYRSVQILASCPKLLLQTAISGDLFRRALLKGDDDEFKLWELFEWDPQTNEGSSWEARKANDFAPCIYVRGLVDSTGDSPTIEELRLVITTLRQYVSGDASYDEQNARIDSATSGKSNAKSIRQGHHHYLNGSLERVSTIHTFCCALEKTLDELHPEADVPSRPLSYVGFASNFTSRQKAHSNGNTNRLSALVVDICKTLFRKQDTNTPEYSMQSYVLCYLKSFEECRIADELFARTMDTYYYGGKGFNIANAGVQVNSADLSRSLHGEATSRWEACQKFRELEPYYKENLKYELSRVEYYLDVQSGKADKDADNQLDKELEAAEAESRRLESLVDHTPTDQEIKEKLEVLRQKHEAQEAEIAQYYPELLMSVKIGNATIREHLWQKAQAFCIKTTKPN